ncbi:hypothetical protein [Vibrio phage phiKT1024]|nr:hypothetical protein [Vibrio phage phiKT1024]
MEKLEDYIEVISLKNGDSFTLLRLFSDTSLRETCYIKVSQLYEILKFSSAVELSRKSANFWVFEKTPNGDTHLVYNDEISNLSYQNLVDECNEVKMFCKKYFPEMVI